MWRRIREIGELQGTTWMVDKDQRNCEPEKLKETSMDLDKNQRKWGSKGKIHTVDVENNPHQCG